MTEITDEDVAAFRALFELAVEADEREAWGNRCETDPCRTCTVMADAQHALINLEGRNL